MLYEKLTLSELIDFIIGIYNLDSSTAWDRCEHLLQKFDLQDNLDHFLGSFSRGMKQKAALITTLTSDPQVLVLDEPTNGLDPLSVKRLSFLALTILFLIIFRMSYTFIFSLRNIVPDTQAQLETVLQFELHLLAVTALLLFVILLLNGMRIVYENYFESKDLAFLLTLPVSVSAVFTSKFLKNVTINFLQILPLIGAAWLGYGFGTESNIWYYPIMLLVLICGAIIFTAVATVLLLYLPVNVSLLIVAIKKGLKCWENT